MEICVEIILRVVNGKKSIARGEGERVTRRERVGYMERIKL